MKKEMKSFWDLVVAVGVIFFILHGLLFFYGYSYTRVMLGDNAAPPIAETLEISIVQKLPIDELGYLGGVAQDDIVVADTGIAYAVDADVFLSVDAGYRYCLGMSVFGYVLENYGFAPCP